MKKFATLSCLILLASISVPPAALAVFLGNSNYGKEYLVGVEDLSKWTAGLYYETVTRDVYYRYSTASPMELDRTMLYVGYDFIPWITTYITAGSCDTEIDNTAPYRDDLSYGFGMHFNLLDHDILDPTLFENSIRINAAWEYTMNNADFPNTGNWRELQLSLTLSIVNDIEGNSLYLPNAIAIYAKPILSDIQFGDMNEEEKMGFGAGLEVFYSERVSFHFGMLSFGSNSATAGLHIRL